MDMRNMCIKLQYCVVKERNASIHGRPQKFCRGGKPKKAPNNHKLKGLPNGEKGPPIEEKRAKRPSHGEKAPHHVKK